MLSEFYITLEDFERELNACGTRLARWENVNHVQRHKLGNLGHDIIGFGENFIRAHINATMWVADSLHESSRWSPRPLPDSDDIRAYLSGRQEELNAGARASVERHFEQGRLGLERMHRQSESRARTESDAAARDLKTGYKAYFYFIRAFHDACYGVLLNLSGQQPGDYSSMGRCIDREAPPIFGEISTLPGYIEWFRDFRVKRNTVKLGTNFSLFGSQSDVGVRFIRATPDGGSAMANDGFRLPDLITAINQSSNIVTLIADRIPCNTQTQET